MAKVETSDASASSSSVTNLFQNGNALDWFKQARLEAKQANAGFTQDAALCSQIDGDEHKIKDYNNGIKSDQKAINSDAKNVQSDFAEASKDGHLGQVKIKTGHPGTATHDFKGAEHATEAAANYAKDAVGSIENQQRLEQNKHSREKQIKQDEQAIPGIEQTAKTDATYADASMQIGNIFAQLGLGTSA